jgi:hypothetical protein
MYLSDAGGSRIDAEYSVEPDGNYLAVILESRGGTKAGTKRNPAYKAALLTLLGRLKLRDATLVEALVDSSDARVRVPDEQGRTVLRDSIRLANSGDLDKLRAALMSPQGRIGQHPGASKAGTNSKKLRIRVSVPGYSPKDAERLSADLAEARFTGESLPVPEDDSGSAPAGNAAPRRTSHGAGRLADAKVRVAIKEHAERWAQDRFENLGFEVVNVGDFEPYDLHATKGPEELHIEVKGSSSPAIEHVELTIGEVNHAPTATTHLVVVDEIRWSRRPDGKIETQGGRPRMWRLWRPEAVALAPTRFRYQLPPGGELEA